MSPSREPVTGEIQVPSGPQRRVALLDQLTVVCLDRAGCILKLSSAMSEDETADLTAAIEDYDEAIGTLAGLLCQRSHWTVDPNMKDWDGE